MSILDCISFSKKCFHKTIPNNPHPHLSHPLSLNTWNKSLLFLLCQHNLKELGLITNPKQTKKLSFNNLWRWDQMSRISKFWILVLLIVIQQFHTIDCIQIYICPIWNRVTRHSRRKWFAEISFWNQFAFGVNKFVGRNLFSLQLGSRN